MHTVLHITSYDVSHTMSNLSPNHPDGALARR
jgi:hypothetical protein